MKFGIYVAIYGTCEVLHHIFVSYMQPNQRCYVNLTTNFNGVVKDKFDDIYDLTPSNASFCSYIPVYVKGFLLNSHHRLSPKLRDIPKC